jgi:biotin transporter BioY
MNNLYHKLAVASVCTALSFVLGASEEVKAATITVPPTIQFGVRTMFGVFGGSSTDFTPESDDVFFAPRPGGGPQNKVSRI